MALLLCVMHRETASEMLQLAHEIEGFCWRRRNDRVAPRDHQTGREGFGIVRKTTSEIVQAVHKMNQRELKGGNQKACKLLVQFEEEAAEALERPLLAPEDLVKKGCGRTCVVEGTAKES